MDILLNILKNQKFIENIFLLVVTTVMTGLLVPFIKGSLDKRTLQKEKLLEKESQIAAIRMKYLSPLRNTLKYLLERFFSIKKSLEKQRS